MLSQMTKKLNVRLDGRSIDTEHLDITSYLSACFNSCKEHVGTVHYIFTKLINMGWQKKLTAYSKLTTRRMDKVVVTLANETG
jgi:hypothetical protein